MQKGPHIDIFECPRWTGSQPGGHLGVCIMHA